MKFEEEKNKSLGLRVGFWPGNERLRGARKSIRRSQESNVKESTMRQEREDEGKMDRDPNITTEPSMLLLKETGKEEKTKAQSTISHLGRRGVGARE